MQSATPVRQKDAIADLLATSECQVRLRAAAGSDPARLLTAELKDACVRVGATATIGQAGGEPQITICAPHDRIDAFGLMFMVARLCRPAARAALSLQPRRGRAGAYAYVQHTRRARPAGEPGRTLTQRFAEAMAERLGLPSEARLAFAVAVDDPELRTLDDFGGNGFILVELELVRLRALAAGPKQRWREELLERARRVRAVALRRPGLRRSDAFARISSLGDVGRLSFAADAPWLEPASFEQVSTPGSQATTNVFLWGRDDQQALALCGPPDHPLMLREREMIDAWNRALG